MFQLALRLWTGSEMIYPVKFSVMFDPATKKSSVRAFVKNDKFITFDYMMITPFNAINGPIFENDIIVVDGDEEHLKIVEFNVEKGIYIAKDIDGPGYIKMNNSHKYETAGNIYEDKDLLGIDSETEFVEKKENEKKEEVPEKKEVENKKSKKEKKQREEKNIDVEEKLEDNVPTSVVEEPVTLEKEVPLEEPIPLEDNISLDDKNISIEKEIVIEEDITTSEEEKIDDKEDIKEQEKQKEQEEKLENNNFIEETTNMPEIDESEYLDNEEPNILVNKGDKKIMNIHFISVCGDNSKGGYAFTFECENIKDTYKGAETDTNSKKIDLSGIVSALEMLDGNFDVVLFTTSQYVVYPFFKGWIHKWKESNWFKNDTDRIQNYELWSELYDFSEKYNIKWNFVDKLTEDMEECKKFAEEEIF